MFAAPLKELKEKHIVKIQGCAKEIVFKCESFAMVATGGKVFIDQPGYATVALKPMSNIISEASALLTEMHVAIEAAKNKAAKDNKLKQQLDVLENHWKLLREKVTMFHTCFLELEKEHKVKCVEAKKKDIQEKMNNMPRAGDNRKRGGGSGGGGSVG